MSFGATDLGEASNGIGSASQSSSAPPAGSFDGSATSSQVSKGFRAASSFPQSVDVNVDGGARVSGSKKRLADGAPVEASPPVAKVPRTTPSSITPEDYWSHLAAGFDPEPGDSPFFSAAQLASSVAANATGDSPRTAHEINELLLTQAGENLGAPSMGQPILARPVVLSAYEPGSWSPEGTNPGLDLSQPNYFSMLTTLQQSQAQQQQQDRRLHQQILYETQLQQQILEAQKVLQQQQLQMQQHQQQLLSNQALAVANYGQPTRSRPKHLEEKSSNKFQFLDITQFLTMPQCKAAEQLGMPASTLSKRWKEAVRERIWPYRQVKQIDKDIASLLQSVPDPKTATALPDEANRQLQNLLQQRQEALTPVVIRLAPTDATVAMLTHTGSGGENTSIPALEYRPLSSTDAQAGAESSVTAHRRPSLEPRDSSSSAQQQADHPPPSGERKLTPAEQAIAALRPSTRDKLIRNQQVLDEEDARAVSSLQRQASELEE